MPTVTFPLVNMYKHPRYISFDGTIPGSGDQFAVEDGDSELTDNKHTKLELGATAKNGDRSSIFLSFALQGLLPGAIVNSAKLIGTAADTSSEADDLIYVHVLAVNLFVNANRSFFLDRFEITAAGGGAFQVALKVTADNGTDVLAENVMALTDNSSRFEWRLESYGDMSRTINSIFTDLKNGITVSARRGDFGAGGSIISDFGSDETLGEVEIGLRVVNFPNNGAAGNVWMEVWDGRTLIATSDMYNGSSAFSGSEELFTFNFTETVTIPNGTALDYLVMQDREHNIDTINIFYRAGTGSDTCKLSRAGILNQWCQTNYVKESTLPYPFNVGGNVNNNNSFARAGTIALGTWTSGEEFEILLDGTNGTIIQQWVDSDAFKGEGITDLPGQNQWEGMIHLCIIPENTMDHLRNADSEAAGLGTDFKLIIDYDLIDNSKFIG